MATTLEFIYAVSKIWPSISAHPCQSPNDTSERSQFLLGQGVIHPSIFSNCSWFQVPGVVSDVHMNCVIIILGKAATTVAKRTFLNLPNWKTVEDSIYGLLAFVRVGEGQVIHMSAHHSGKLLGLTEEEVCRRTYLGCHEILVPRFRRSSADKNLVQHLRSVHWDSAHQHSVLRDLSIKHRQSSARRGH